MVSGWFRGEFTAIGEPWLDHDERYRRSEEFIRCLRGIWTEDTLQLQRRLLPLPRLRPEAEAGADPHPEIFQGGNSRAARAMAARVSDWYFINGNTPDGITRRRSTRSAPRRRPTGRDASGSAPTPSSSPARPRREAQDVLREIIAKADVEAVHGFGEAVKQAGKSSPDKQGKWATRTSRIWCSTTTASAPDLIGTPEQIAEQIVALKEIGVDLVLCGFLHFQEEVEFFGQRVIPLVRELERGAAPARHGLIAAE